MIKILDRIKTKALIVVVFYVIIVLGLQTALFVLEFTFKQSYRMVYWIIVILIALLLNKYLLRFVKPEYTKKLEEGYALKKEYLSSEGKIVMQLITFFVVYAFLALVIKDFLL